MNTEPKIEPKQEYISGLGKASIMPPNIKGWNWGAFLLTWIWGIGNNTLIALLMFVPFVNIVMMFVLGAKGNQWAWQNRKWKSIEHFKSIQRKWTISAVFLLFIVFPLFILLIFNAVAGMLKGEAYDLSLQAIKTNKQVIQHIGTPLHPSYFVSGDIKIDNSGGEANLYYTIKGPKGEALAIVKATKTSTHWTLQKVLVSAETDSEYPDIEVVK